MEEVIVFGTGQMGTLFSNILKQFPVKIVCYVDNNETKWHTIKESVMIIAPTEINMFQECPILIACIDVRNIEKQLIALGYQSRIMSLHSLINKKLRFHKHVYAEKVLISEAQTEEKWSVVIDNLSGTWGGAENWSHTLADNLRAYRKTYLVERMGQSYENTIIDTEILRISINDKIFSDYGEIVEKLVSKMPFILVNNLSRDVLYAAIILKGLYPDKVKIITVLHSDFEGMYRMHTFWDDAIDAYHCVSSKIKHTLINVYNVRRDKVFFKESAMKLEHEFYKEYRIGQDEVLNIGMACRLEKEAKRVDLLPLLLEYLENKDILYRLNIAGEGDCAELVKKYIGEHKLEKKVILYGLIPKEEMSSFWKQQDLFVSISDFEGASLSMLEAMMHGVVPVVTRVSGVDDFVKNNENGLIYEVHDLQGVAGGIEHMCFHRELLLIYGERCKKVICEKCDEKIFLSYFLNLLNFVEG